MQIFESCSHHCSISDGPGFDHLKAQILLAGNKWGYSHMSFLLFISESTLKTSTLIYCLHKDWLNEKTNPSDLHFKGWLFALGFKYYTWKMDIFMNIHEMFIKTGRHSSCKGTWK